MHRHKCVHKKPMVHLLSLRQGERADYESKVMRHYRIESIVLRVRGQTECGVFIIMVGEGTKTVIESGRLL